MEIEKSYADEAAIHEELLKLKSLVPFCQHIYNSFKKIGIPLQLKDIREICGQFWKGTDDQFLREYLRNILHKLPKNERLRVSDIPLPDFSDIQDWSIKNWPKGYQHYRGFSVDHLELKDGKIILLTLTEEKTRKKYTQKHKVHDADEVAEAAANGNPILIQHDEHHIANTIGEADEAIHDGQQVYDMFKTMGVEVNLDEIKHLLLSHGSKQHVAFDHIHSMVADKLLIKAGPQSFNGIPIKREKLRDMIQVPDVSAIERRVNELAHHWVGGSNATKKFRVEHLQIKDGKLTYADGFHESLNEKHIHTTKSIHGLEVAAKLMEVSKTVIEMCEMFGKNDKGRYLVGPEMFTIPGLKMVTTPLPKSEHYTFKNRRFETEFVGFRIDLDFIREQEARDLND